MLNNKEKSRPTTEQLIFLILYRHDGQGNSLRYRISVRDIQKELALQTGRERSIAYIRKLIRKLELKGAIKRDFNYLHSGHLGNEAQATRYIVKDIVKGFDFTLTDQELKIRDKMSKKAREEHPNLPESFYEHGYKPSKSYTEGYSPFYQAATRGDLPPRYPKGDPRNYERQKIVNMRLIQEKARQNSKT